MGYQLPTSITVGGKAYKIRSDYRAALDIFAALADIELSPREQALSALVIMFEDFKSIPPEYYLEALKETLLFLNCGKEIREKSKSPQLVDWEQDFQYIVAPINRIMNTEIRSADYIHWWTFVAAYYEIGNCTFAQIVRIRDKKAKGEKLDKAEQQWYRQNRDIVDIKTKYSEKEAELLAEWTT